MELSNSVEKMNSNQTEEKKEIEEEEKKEIKFKNKWTLWAHLPTETSWEMSSFIHIGVVSSIEECVILAESLHPELIKSCMLFFMKDDITPRWEDVKNVDGGSFSFKVYNNSISRVWKDLMYCITGRCLSSNIEFLNSINGITISPKKQFCILKLWLNNTIYNNSSLITLPPKCSPLSFKGCLFTPHREPKKIVKFINK